MLIGPNLIRVTASAQFSELIYLNILHWNWDFSQLSNLIASPHGAALSAFAQNTLHRIQMHSFACPFNWRRSSVCVFVCTRKWTACVCRFGAFVFHLMLIEIYNDFLIRSISTEFEIITTDIRKKRTNQVKVKGKMLKFPWLIFDGIFQLNSNTSTILSKRAIKFIPFHWNHVTSMPTGLSVVQSVCDADIFLSIYFCEYIQMGYDETFSIFPSFVRFYFRLWIWRATAIVLHSFSCSSIRKNEFCSIQLGKFISNVSVEAHANAVWRNSGSLYESGYLWFK